VVSIPLNEHVGINIIFDIYAMINDDLYDIVCSVAMTSMPPMATPLATLPATLIAITAAATWC
jgi:hypothetical protein